MKKLILILIVSSTTLFISCGNDDDSNSNPDEVDGSTNKNLIGEWNLTSIKTENGSMEYFGDEILFNYTSIGNNLTAKMTFSDEPNTLKVSGGFTDIRKIDVEGQENIVDFDINFDIFMLGGRGWKVENGFIYDHIDGSLEVSEVAEITAIDEQKLTLKIVFRNRTITTDSEEPPSQDSGTMYAEFEKTN